MELSAKYVYQVYQQRSFSAAAKALYISQPALSAAIGRLERELGIRIFDRSTIPLSLTPQGRIYIESLEQIMESESNMRRRLRGLSDMSCGSLCIAGGSYASYFLMSWFCGVFYRKYPEIRVTLDIGNTGTEDDLWEKLKNDEVDLMISYDGSNAQFAAEPLLEERLIISMHKQLPGAERLKHLALTREQIISGDYDESRQIEDMSVFRDVDFLDFGGGSYTAQRMTQLLGDYRTARYTICNARHSEMHYNLMCAGIGAMLTTDILIAKTGHDADNILYFVPRSPASYRPIYLVYKHGVTENPILRNFIRVAKEVCTGGEVIRSHDFRI